jgi:hypothetical protein
MWPWSSKQEPVGGSSILNLYMENDDRKGLELRAVLTEHLLHARLCFGFWKFRVG